MNRILLVDVNENPEGMHSIIIIDIKGIEIVESFKERNNLYDLAFKVSDLIMVYDVDKLVISSIVESDFKNTVGCFLQQEEWNLDEKGNVKKQGCWI